MGGERGGVPQRAASKPEARGPRDPGPLTSQALDGSPVLELLSSPLHPTLPVKIYSVPHTNTLGKICDEETRGIVHKYSQPYANNLKFIFLFFKEEKKNPPIP